MLSEGYIGLQSESQPVEFRRVELLNLTGCMNPKAANFKSYYVNRDDTQCTAAEAIFIWLNGAPAGRRPSHWRRRARDSRRRTS